VNLLAAPIPTAILKTHFNVLAPLKSNKFDSSNCFHVFFSSFLTISPHSNDSALNQRGDSFFRTVIDMANAIVAKSKMKRRGRKRKMLSGAWTSESVAERSDGNAKNHSPRHCAVCITFAKRTDENLTLDKRDSWRFGLADSIPGSLNSASKWPVPSDKFQETRCEFI
jgi:hypothetical protein